MFAVVIIFFVVFLFLLGIMFCACDDEVDYDELIKEYNLRLNELELLMKENNKKINKIYKMLLENKKKIKRLFK